MASQQKITTCLWFEKNAEEAIDFYRSVFRNSRLLDVMRAGDGAPVPKGSIVAASFELEGQQFSVINGGPAFKFSEAMSLVVHCETQAEVDALWDKLGNGGQYQACGWLKDRFGVSWQIVPDVLLRLLRDPDAAKAQRVMQAMLQMQKIDIARLQQAANER